MDLYLLSLGLNVAILIMLRMRSQEEKLEILCIMSIILESYVFLWKMLDATA